MPNAQCLIPDALLASSLSSPQERSAALSRASAAIRAGHSRAAARSTATFTSALTAATTTTAATATTAAVQFADDFDNIQLRPNEGPSIEAMGEMMPVLIKLRKVAT